MLIYILLFITVALPAFLISPQNQEKRKNIITFYAVVVCATLTCGLRDMLGGYDSYIYGDIFDSTAEQLRNGLDYSLTTAWTENKNEEGYGLYNILIGYITRNRYIYFLITAIIYYIALTRHIIKYCRFPYLCFFFFFCGILRINNWRKTRSAHSKYAKGTYEFFHPFTRTFHVFISPKSLKSAYSCYRKNKGKTMVI